MSSAESMHDSTKSRPLIPHIVRFILLIMILTLIFGGLLWTGFNRHGKAQAEVAQVQKNNRVSVTVTKPVNAPSVSTLTLPAEIKPYLEASIFSRISGTLGLRLVNIGDHVRAGQLLAVVDVPELEQELSQARSLLTQSQASLVEQKARVALAKSSLARWKQNAQTGGVSQQDVEQRQTDYNANIAAYQAIQAQIQQNKANIKRLLALQRYEKITAPFSGFITARNVDPGANIVAGGSSTSTNLFSIAQTEVLRIFINVPQSNVPTIQKGLNADITLAELPGQVFHGTIARTANALDPATRTLLTEIDLPNPHDVLHPGMFAQASLKLPRVGRLLLVDDNALVIDERGVQVITITPKHKLHFIRVQMGRDNGIQTEIKVGLQGHEKLVANPSDQLRENQTVEILSPVRL